MNKMTEGSPAKLILTFSIPIFIGNIFQQLYSMVDTIIVGKTLGVGALAAVGATGCINFLVLGFAIGITSGFAVPIAQSYGAGDIKRLRHNIIMAFYLSVISTIVLTAASVGATGWMLDLIKTPSDIYDGSYSYIRVIFLGIGCTIFYNMIAGVLRALGDSRTPLYFLILSSVLNVVLDFVFILSFHTGVMGASLATIVSQGVSAILCLLYAARKYAHLKVLTGDRRFRFQTAARMLVVGIPMALQFSITAIGTMILQSAINAIGSSAVAAFTAACKVEQLTTQPLDTLGTTMATYTAQNYGARRFDRIREGVRKCVLISCCFAIAGAGIILLIGKPALYLFVSSEETEVIGYALQYLHTVIVFYIPLGMIFLFRNALQGLGHGFIPMSAGAFELAGRSVMAFFFAERLGFLAVCLAEPTAWLLADIPLILYYFMVAKKFPQTAGGGKEPASV